MTAHHGQAFQGRNAGFGGKPPFDGVVSNRSSTPRNVSIMKTIQSDFVTALKLSPRAFATSVVGLCIALAGVMGCQGAAAAADASRSESGPIRKHPDNPHYFAYKGKPLVLITTDEHYGAVINLDFDYIPFLDRLHEYGMNLTRIYPGGIIELKDQYAKGNPLGPAPGRFLLPWKQSAVTGANKNLGTLQIRSRRLGRGIFPAA